MMPKKARMKAASLEGNYPLTVQQMAGYEIIVHYHEGRMLAKEIISCLDVYPVGLQSLKNNLEGLRLVLVNFGIGRGRGCSRYTSSFFEGPEGRES